MLNSLFVNYIEILEPFFYFYFYFLFKFPSNVQLKEKWIKNLGLYPKCVNKNTKICSTHFLKSSFHDTDHYTSVRLLIQISIGNLYIHFYAFIYY